LRLDLLTSFCWSLPGTVFRRGVVVLLVWGSFRASQMARPIPTRAPIRLSQLREINPPSFRNPLPTFSSKTSRDRAGVSIVPGSATSPGDKDEAEY